MRDKPIYSFLIFLLISFSAAAQNKPIRFQSINSIGFVAGESNANAEFQTVNGIQLSNWFSGIGVGLDYYRYKTVPLFFDARRYFEKEKKVFVYGDLGYDLPMKNRPGKEVGNYDSYHSKGGLYTDIGIGYKTNLIKKTSFSFSLGYSYKELQTNIGVTTRCFQCQPEFYSYKFNYGRMIMKAGLEF
ncbi:MAG: hypothetical protein M3Z26_01575 [Bacteroidota bacterium]|nr:hypothetical protein [Bacteroidota bacterium]